MKKSVNLIVLLTLLLTACNLSAPASTPTATSTALPSSTPRPSSTPAPSPTPAPTQDALRQPLQALIASPYWPALGLPPDQTTKWQSFASGSLALTASERLELQGFLAQWEKWNGWLDSARIPSSEKLAFKVKEFNGAQTGPKLVLYALDEKATKAEGSERLYLAPPADLARPHALILAPRIEGLSQQIDPSGDTVEYHDAQGQPVLKVDAFRTWNNMFEEYVQARYGGSYKEATLYPRYRFFIQGIDAGFFLLDKSLTLKQINFMVKSLELFNEPALAPLKSAFFGEKKIYVVVPSITEVPNASGLTSAGIAVLDRNDLFHLKDDLVGVIAHEATHVLQNIKSEARCSYEVGDGTIPDGFENWSADRLVTAIEDGAIGAEHVDLWVFMQLDSGGSRIASSEDAITSHGVEYWAYCTPDEAELTLVKITNTLDKKVTVFLRGPISKTFSIPAGSTIGIVILTGTYEYVVDIAGAGTMTGTRTFNSGTVTWRIANS